MHSQRYACAPMAYDPLLELLNCEVPSVRLPSGPGSSRQTPRKTGGPTLPNVLSKHVASDLQLRHVYHANIADKAVQLLEKAVRDGNRERVDLGGSERLLDQATLDSECSLQRWIARKSYEDDAGRFIEASVEKEVEFFGTNMIQIILLVAVRIAFLIAESRGPMVEVFKANPSPSEGVPGTEEKFDLKELIKLERSLPHPTAGTLRRIKRAKEAMVKLKFVQAPHLDGLLITLFLQEFCFRPSRVEILPLYACGDLRRNRSRCHLSRNNASHNSTHRIQMDYLYRRYLSSTHGISGQC